MIQSPSWFPVFKEQELFGNTLSLSLGRNLFLSELKCTSFMCSIRLSFKHKIGSPFLLFLRDTHRGWGEIRRACMIVLGQ